VRIEYAVLADHAEIVNGKLYLMGGGWDTYNATQAPVHVRMAIAIGVRIEWEETNKPVPVRVHVEDDDGLEIMRAEGALNVGRPPHLPPGSGQLAQMAVTLPADIPRFGGYRIRIVAGDTEPLSELALPFRVNQRQ